MSTRRHKASRSADILRFLETHPRQTTTEIAAGVNWTTQRVSAALWAELLRTPSFIVREEIPSKGNRTRPTLVYTHVNYWPEPVPEPPTTKPELPEPATLEKEVHQPPEAVGSLDDFADALAKAIAQHVVSRVKGHLETQLKAILPPAVATPTPLSIEQLTQQVMKPENSQPKKPTILIAGLLPNQAGIIHKEFDDVFDLRFYMVGESLKHLASMANTVDHVFTFTSKVSHAVEEVMVGKGHKVHRCSGGMTMLKNQLLELYAEGTI
jgi:hypothetical protein